MPLFLTTLTTELRHIVCAVNMKRMIESISTAHVPLRMQGGSSFAWDFRKRVILVFK
jgi:hypothetical protein